MDKKYKYRNGEQAKVLCTDGYMEDHPVVSMKENGNLYVHRNTGEWDFDNSFDLIEIWEPSEGEWCLFTDDHARYVLSRLREELINKGKYKYADINKAMWKYCYKFDGTLPHDN